MSDCQDHAKEAERLAELANMCGCFADEDLDAVEAALTSAGHNPLEGTFASLVQHSLTAAGLLEHGTAIRQSWLTAKGKRWLADYERWRGKE